MLLNLVFNALIEKIIQCWPKWPKRQNLGPKKWQSFVSLILQPIFSIPSTFKAHSIEKQVFLKLLFNAVIEKIIKSWPKWPEHQNVGQKWPTFSFVIAW